MSEKLPKKLEEKLKEIKKFGNMFVLFEIDDSELKEIMGVIFQYEKEKFEESREEIKEITGSIIQKIIDVEGAGRMEVVEVPALDFSGKRIDPEKLYKILEDKGFGLEQFVIKTNMDKESAVYSILSYLHTSPLSKTGILFDDENKVALWMSEGNRYLMWIDKG